MGAEDPARPALVAVTIVKARSARVPGKNFRRLGDRPLFRWVLDTLTSMPEVERVVIDTDARAELGAAGLVESDRLRLHDRRPELRGDDVTANTLLADLLPAVPAERYLMTHVTNPFLSADTIRRALAAHASAAARGEADSLFSVDRIQTRLWTAEGAGVNHDPAHLVPTQELEPWFVENSSLYLFTGESFARTGARVGERPLLFETPRSESVDIDEEEDWALAERVAAGLTTRS